MSDQYLDKLVHGTEPEDTGGLNLDTPAPESEPEIDLSAFAKPAGTKFAAAAPDLEFMTGNTPALPGRFSGAHENLANGPAELPAVVADPNGLDLQGAINGSVFLRLAALPTPDPNFLLMSNNLRFWTARATDFEPAGYSMNYDLQVLRTTRGWRPVLGTEQGWILG